MGIAKLIFTKIHPIKGAKYPRNLRIMNHPMQKDSQK
jgi:hypothetical protein